MSYIQYTYIVKLGALGQKTQLSRNLKGFSEPEAALKQLTVILCVRRTKNQVLGLHELILSMPQCAI